MSTMIGAGRGHGFLSTTRLATVSGSAADEYVVDSKDTSPNSVTRYDHYSKLLLVLCTRFVAVDLTRPENKRSVHLPPGEASAPW